MFKSYVWKDESLKAKSKQYNALTIACIVGVILFFFLIPTDVVTIAHQIGVGFAALALVTWWMSYRCQSKDKKLNKVNK